MEAASALLGPGATASAALLEASTFKSKAVLFVQLLVEAIRVHGPCGGTFTSCVVQANWPLYRKQSWKTGSNQQCTMRAGTRECLHCFCYSCTIIAKHVLMLWLTCGLRADIWFGLLCWFCLWNVCSISHIVCLWITPWKFSSFHDGSLLTASSGLFSRADVLADCGGLFLVIV